ncbi:MAG: diaminopimelate epimerase [Desulfobacterales bacterium]|nr:diaminopimelate epimerase [Desulfobacterales bacterium]MDD4071834.1 diaminopimelate epimerase [Desulfobacterales bacterium]MDD4392541.1 diaminopimelate epimerase [Desulfobacterales bacterium]
MENITFYKMSGSGNDFIIIDNRDRVVDETCLTEVISKICRRKMSIGADGFILIERSDAVAFKWRFFNSDGSIAEMCGNGARCAARFAWLNGIAGKDMSFETDAGIISARVTDGRVKIRMTDPVDLKTDYSVELKSGPVTLGSANTGVPHAVIPVDDLDAVQVVQRGSEIRYHQDYAPAGTNVNFVCPRGDNTIGIRTYERGVEDETLACGTGSVAAALIMASRGVMISPIDVITRSGATLTVYFKKHDGRFSDVYLEGDARLIYTAQLCKDAWNY